MRARNGSCLRLLVLTISLGRLLTASILKIEVLEGLENDTAVAVKGGTCPGVKVETTNQNCTEECQSDASCEGAEKCCRTGCGASCQLPNDKPGSCPTLSIGISMLGACHDSCHDDSDCPDDKKCCQNGCGKLACTSPRL